MFTMLASMKERPWNQTSHHDLRHSLCLKNHSPMQAAELHGGSCLRST